MEDIVNILTQISSYVGVDFNSIFKIAVIMTIVMNYLKTTKPFSNVVKGNVITVLIFTFSLIISTIMLWHDIFKILFSTFAIAILSIGGWASAKIIANKVKDGKNG